MAVTPNNNPGSNPNQLNEKQLKRLIELLQKIDKLTESAAVNQANQYQQAGNAYNQLERLEDTWDDITSSFDYGVVGFRKMLEEIKNSNEGLALSLKTYRGLGSLADKIQKAQRDISETSEKELIKLQEQYKSRKQDLVTSNELLEGKQKELESSKNLNKEEQQRTTLEIQRLEKLQTSSYTKERENTIKSEREKLIQLENTYSSIETQVGKNNDALKQNKAIIDDIDANAEGVKFIFEDLSKKIQFRNIENLDKKFVDISEEAQSTKESIKTLSKGFDTMASIMQKVQDHQNGISRLSEKDATKQLEKLESTRKEFEVTNKRLKKEQEILKIRQQGISQSIAQKEVELESLKASGARTEEIEKSEEALRDLRTEQTEVNIGIEANEKSQVKISDYISKQNKAYNKLVDNLKSAKKEAENMRKALGLSGAAVDGIGKAFNKLGLGGLTTAMGLDDAKDKMKEVADRITDGGKKAAGLGGQFRILGAGLKEIGKNLLKNLTDPVTIVTGLVAGITAGIKGLISLFEESAKYTGDIAKTFGISANEASKIGDNLRSAAGSDFFMNNEQARAAFDAMANATGVINSNFSDQKAVSAMNDMVTYAGRSVEAYGGLLRMGKLNNMEADDMEKSLRGQLTLLQKNNKLRINESQAVEMVAKASATVRMNLGANPKKLADAAFYATKLGMTLDEISSAAEQTLNFESAIQNQLEYQLLSGKEINIDAYQQAALSGDAATASKELNKLIEEQGPAIQGNVLAQESLAKTLGISREQLMKSLELQKVQKKIGGDVAQIEKAINAEMAKGLTLEEASAKVGEKNYESIVKQNKNAAAFSNTVSQIKEAFMNALSGSEGFKTLFSEDNIKHYVDVIQQDIIPAVVKLAQLAGKFIGFLSKKETIETLKNGFNGLVDTIKLLKEPIKFIVENLGTISKILLAIATVKVGMNIAKGIGGIFSTIKDLTSGKFGKPGSRSNPLYVSPVGGGMGGPGMDMDGPGGPKNTMSRRQRNINRALKTGLGIAAAYTAYKAFSGKGAEDFSNEEVQSYMQQNGITDEGQAREQMASQQYQTGSKAGDLGIAGVEAISAASINTGKSVSATSPKPLAKNQKAAYQSARSQGVPAQQAMQQARNVKPEKGMFGKALDFMSDMGSSVLKKTGLTDVAGKAKGFLQNPIVKGIGKALGPILSAVMGIMNIQSIISDAKMRSSAGEQVNTGQLGKQIVQSGADTVLKTILWAIPGVGQAIAAADLALGYLGFSPLKWATDNLVDLIPDNAFKDLGNLAIGKQQQAQQVEDGSLNPNGGPVVSTFQKGELVPIMQGIKEDNVYMTTNKPVQVQDGYYGRSTSQDNSAFANALDRFTEALSGNKEVTLVINGKELGTALIPIMTPGVVRQINNNSVSI